MPYTLLLFLANDLCMQKVRAVLFVFIVIGYTMKAHES